MGSICSHWDSRSQSQQQRHPQRKYPMNKLTPKQSKFSRHSNIENFDPEDFEFLLGKAPVSDVFEDPYEYDIISHSMLQSIRPTNYIESLFVVDLIDITF